MSEMNTKMVGRVDLDNVFDAYDDLIRENKLGIDLANENDYARIIYVDPKTEECYSHPFGYDDEKDDMDEDYAAVQYILEQMDAGKKVFFIDRDAIAHHIVPDLDDGCPKLVSFYELRDESKKQLTEPVMPEAPEKPAGWKYFLNKITFGAAFKTALETYEKDTAQHVADMQEYTDALEHYNHDLEFHQKMKEDFACLSVAQVEYDRYVEARRIGAVHGNNKKRELITDKQLIAETKGSERSYEEKLADIEDRFFGNKPAPEASSPRPSQQKKGDSIKVYEPANK